MVGASSSAELRGEIYSPGPFPFGNCLPVGWCPAAVELLLCSISEPAAFKQRAKSLPRREPSEGAARSEGECAGPDSGFRSYPGEIQCRGSQPGCRWGVLRSVLRAPCSASTARCANTIHKMPPETANRNPECQKHSDLLGTV